MSRICWLQKKMKGMMGVLSEVGDHSEEVVIELLRALAKKQGMVFAKKSGFQLSVAQSMIFCDHVGTGTNGLYRLKQALELLIRYI